MKTPDLVGTVTGEKRPNSFASSADRGPQATDSRNAVLQPSPDIPAPPSAITPPERPDAIDAGALPALPEGAELFDDTDDDLRTARGFLTGILLAVPMWGMIGLMVWLFIGR
jgi:hypothetical protein